jgi:dihydrofolate reductase
MSARASQSTRKLIYSLLVSLDGFINGPGGELSGRGVDREFMQFVNEQQVPVDTSLFGRKMYQVMKFWDTAEDIEQLSDVELEFARQWNRQEKVVFSRTNQTVEGNARLATGSLEEEIQALKATPGGNIEIGGANLASQAIALDLVDEYGLFVQPFFTGGGTRFFPEHGPDILLERTGFHQFASGMVYLRYSRIGEGSGNGTDTRQA